MCASVHVVCVTMEAQVQHWLISRKSSLEATIQEGCCWRYMPQS